MPISDYYKTIYIHIPKTGGTAIERMLNLKIGQENLINCNIKNGPIYQHFTPNKLKPLIPSIKWNSYYKFVTVRHPLQRALSDYMFFKRNNRIKDISKLNIDTFEKYCLLAKDIVEREAYDENPFFDHFIPQHLYFEGIDYDKVIRMENFNEDIKEVKLSIGCQTNIGHAQTSSKDKPIPSINEIKLIENIYYKDYKLLNYSFSNNT